MKKYLLVIIGFFLGSFLLINHEAFSQVPMNQPDLETLTRWIESYHLLPPVEMPQAISLELDQSAAMGVPTSFSLLPRLNSVPIERDQGYCGNCWLWVGTGIIEIALNLQTGIRDRLSIQFPNSCMNDYNACCSVGLGRLGSWYRSKGFSIPWSNTNALLISSFPTH